MIQKSTIAPPTGPNTRARASTSQALELDAARREYVAQQHAIRNTPLNYNPLPIPGSTATNSRLPPDPHAPSTTNTPLPSAPAVSDTALPQRSTLFAAHTASRSAVTRSRVTALLETRPVKGRPADMSKYYSTPGAQFIGLVSDLHSLAHHQAVFYAKGKNSWSQR